MNELERTPRAPTIAAVADMWPELSNGERSVMQRWLTSRFGRLSEAEVGSILRLGESRIREIQRMALVKLRGAARSMGINSVADFLG